jgi:flagellar hook-associated protein 1
VAGLFSALNIAVSAMEAEQGALEVSSNNIANVNTPGYSREVPVLQENPPVDLANLQFGTGVTLSSVQSIRDNILELRLNQETSQQNLLDTQVNGLNQIQALFNDPAGSGLQTVISNFFNSFQQLAADPSSSNDREAVIIAGQTLATAFNQAANALTTQQQSLDQSVVQSVSQVNDLTSQIASLNQQIAASQSAGTGSGVLVDQRTQLIRQLSQLMNVSVTDEGNGAVTVTAANGAALVVGNQSFNLSTQTNPATGFHDVFYQGTDITSAIQSGQLGGQIELRDTEIPSVLSSLDTLASGIANAVNATSTAGFDANGNPGVNFFVPPAAGPGAAANLAVAITNPSLVAASSDGTSGSNGNANALAALANQNIVGGQTPTDYYASLVAQIGNDASAAQTQQQSESLVLQQLQDQRGSVSGVSLNEEAANLIKTPTRLLLRLPASSISLRKR